MSYASLDQRDQNNYWSAAPPYDSQNDFELKSTAPSISSVNSSFVGYGGPVRSDSASDYQNLLRPIPGDNLGTQWSPGFWKQLPILGILSLFGVLASTLATLVVLVCSHKQPLDDWGYGIAPSVYLAILSVIANALSAYALANGLEITFWRNALKGRTLAELNQNWLCGQNLWHAIFQGYRIGGRITALACVLSVLGLLRGPLNQRASAVQTKTIYSTFGNIDLSMAQTLPDNYTGLARNSRARIQEIARLTPAFAQIMQEHSMRASISIAYEDCGATCFTTVKGFGFKSECRNEEYLQDKNDTNAANLTIFEASTMLYPIGPLASSGYYYDNMGMRLNATYRVPLSNEDRNSTPKSSLRFRLRSHVCDLTGAIVEYDVQLKSKTVERIRERVVKDLIMTGPGIQFHHSTIGGFEYAARYLFSSKAVFNFAGAVSSTSLSGSLANEMIVGDTWNESFHDPMQSMVKTMQEIAFRTSVRAGKDLANTTDTKQKVQYNGSATRSVYITDFRYMIAAVVLSIASVVAVGLTFYGWWELGRTVSLSPLEIAKAFDAPLLSQVGSNLDLSRTKNLGAIGAEKIQYGEQISEQVYSTSYEGGNIVPQSRKLGIGLAGRVRRPEKNGIYST